MNERTKLLAEKAGLKVESWMTNPPKPFQILGSTEQFEKFSELIVKECAKVALEHDAFWGASVDQDIKRHFGVEE
jgi:hypothetical protein